MKGKNSGNRLCKNISQVYLTFCSQILMAGMAAVCNRLGLSIYILRKMPGMFLNVFFNYLWNSLDHVLENGFNFLCGIIIIEKVTGISSIPNAFVLAKAQSWGIFWFSYSILFFLLCCMIREKKRIGMKGKWIWCQLFLLFLSSDLCFPWALSSVRKRKSATTLRVWKMNRSFYTFRKHSQ